MNRALTTALALSALALPAGAEAKPKGTPYKGKTSSGHTVKFKARGGKMYGFVAGIPTHCLSIQGGGAPLTYSDLWDGRGWWIYQTVKNAEMKYVGDTAGYKNVTKTHHVTTKRLRNGTIRGKLRLQYSFMVPKFPIGTFGIYSCLGNTRFSAKPVRKR